MHMASRLSKILGCLSVLGLLVLSVAEVWAIINLRDDLELEGFMQSQAVLRTPQYKDATLVVQRNSIQLENTWNFIRNSQTSIGGLSTGLLEEATFKLIYRFAYDSTYDISDSRREHFTKGQRSQLKFENWIREAYVDLALHPLPCASAANRSSGAKPTPSGRWTSSIPWIPPGTGRANPGKTSASRCS